MVYFGILNNSRIQVKITILSKLDIQQRKMKFEHVWAQMI